MIANSPVSISFMTTKTVGPLTLGHSNWDGVPSTGLDSIQNFGGSQTSNIGLWEGFSWLQIGLGYEQTLADNNLALKG